MDTAILTKTKRVTDLSPFFTADTVAVVGASNSKGKVGYDVVNNLKEFGYPGKIVPINIKCRFSDRGNG